MDTVPVSEPTSDLLSEPYIPVSFYYKDASFAILCTIFPHLQPNPQKPAADPKPNAISAFLSAVATDASTNVSLFFRRNFWKFVIALLASLLFYYERWHQASSVHNALTGSSFHPETQGFALGFSDPSLVSRIKACITARNACYAVVTGPGGTSSAIAALSDINLQTAHVRYSTVGRRESLDDALAQLLDVRPSFLASRIASVVSYAAAVFEWPALNKIYSDIGSVKSLLCLPSASRNGQQTPPVLLLDGVQELRPHDHAELLDIAARCADEGVARFVLVNATRTGAQPEQVPRPGIVMWRAPAWSTSAVPGAAAIDFRDATGGILFHFQPRPALDGAPARVVMNSFLRGAWGQEQYLEYSELYGSFESAGPLTIVAAPSGWEVRRGGKAGDVVSTFPHRAPLTKLTCVAGDAWEPDAAARGGEGKTVRAKLAARSYVGCFMPCSGHDSTCIVVDA
jgi:hypothetical protein